MHTVHEGHKNYKCEICEKPFGASREKKLHIKRIHEDLRDHKCDICSKCFVTTRKMNQHMKKNHNTKISKRTK